MKVLKKAVIGTVAVLAGVGVYSAVVNLPVVSGCSFYSDCPQAVGVATATHATDVDDATAHPTGTDQHD